MPLFNKKSKIDTDSFCILISNLPKILKKRSNTKRKNDTELKTTKGKKTSTTTTDTKIDSKSDNKREHRKSNKKEEMITTAREAETDQSTMLSKSKTEQKKVGNKKDTRQKPDRNKEIHNPKINDKKEYRRL